MPKSKRAKVVHLTKTQKNGKERKNNLISSINTAVEQFQHVFVFSVDNMRNTYLKDVRAQLSDSRIFLGKTKVMAKALGSGEEDEPLPNLSQLSRYLTGNVGLLFTSRSPEAILRFFDEYVETDFARAGNPASRDFVVPAGIVYTRAGEVPIEEDIPLEHTLEANLRKLGMPTSLLKGKIILDSPFQVCKEGQILNSNQTALLKTFGVATADFMVQIKAYYSAATQEVVELD